MTDQTLTAILTVIGSMVGSLGVAYLVNIARPKLDQNFRVRDNMIRKLDNHTRDIEFLKGMFWLAHDIGGLSLAILNRHAIVETDPDGKTVEATERLQRRHEQLRKQYLTYFKMPLDFEDEGE